MNNKLIAGIAAMAISASLMSTVAFAADPTLAVDGDTATLSFKVGENGADISESLNEDQITMMAYLVDAAAETVPAYTNQKIVALDQADGGAGSGFGDVLIDATKLETGKKIAVVLGGSDGTTESFFALEEAPPVETMEILIGDVNLDGVVDGDDSTYLRKFTAIPARETATNNNKRAQLKTDLAALGYDIKAREVYELADGSGTILIGDVNLDGVVDGDDSTYLRKFTAIPARETATNNNKRAQLKTDLAALGYDIKARESYTVNEK